MNDRELLELAAKAAGIPTDLAHGGFIDAAGVWYVTRYWNPLTDDSEAFRLMVALKMNVYVGYGSVTVETTNDESESLVKASEFSRNDLGAATRRAITRTAAAVGKEMK